MVYLSGISLAILSPADRELLIAALAQCRARGGSVVFDNNYRPRLWESAQAAAEVYRRVLAHTDIALLTLDDEHAIYGHETARDGGRAHPRLRCQGSGREMRRRALRGVGRRPAA
jgi:2-dehydro-3-deoxygluconokinase